MTNTHESMSDFLVATKKRLQKQGEWDISQAKKEIESDQAAEVNDLYCDINSCSSEDLASWVAEVKAENV